MHITTALLQILTGFIALSWAADRLVAGSAALAKYLGISNLVIGLTIVALGTSAPEIVVSIIASIKGSGDLAVGNALGSNITNVGLVLGLTALIKPLQVASKTLRREFPLLFFIFALIGIFFWDNRLNHLESLVLLVGAVLTILWFIYLAHHQRGKEPLVEEVEEAYPELALGKSIGWVFVGLALLPLSSHLVVEGATHIARVMGVSELVIGLTIVAIGTSLPELAASIAGTLKNEPDIAIGNVIGSNIFNLLVVLPIPAFFKDISIDHLVIFRDYMAMVIAGVLLFIFTYFAFHRNGTPELNRKGGALLLIGYFLYLGILSSHVLT